MSSGEADRTVWETDLTRIRWLTKAPVEDEPTDKDYFVATSDEPEDDPAAEVDY